jgi:hypothetical protein
VAYEGLDALDHCGMRPECGMGVLADLGHGRGRGGAVAGRSNPRAVAEEEGCGSSPISIMAEGEAVRWRGGETLERWR